MQIFGQNIYGILDADLGEYSGELTLILDLLINAQIYITNHLRLASSEMSLNSTADMSITVGLDISPSSKSSGALFTSDGSGYGASMSIE